MVKKVGKRIKACVAICWRWLRRPCFSMSISTVLYNIASQRTVIWLVHPHGTGHTGQPATPCNDRHRKSVACSRRHELLVNVDSHPVRLRVRFVLAIINVFLIPHLSRSWLSITLVVNLCLSNMHHTYCDSRNESVYVCTEQSERTMRNILSARLHHGMKNPSLHGTLCKFVGTPP